MEGTLSNCQLPDWKELPRQYCHQNHPALEPSTMSSCISVSDDAEMFTSEMHDPCARTTVA